MRRKQKCSALILYVLVRHLSSGWFLTRTKNTIKSQSRWIGALCVVYQRGVARQITSGWNLSLRRAFNFCARSLAGAFFLFFSSHFDSKRDRRDAGTRGRAGLHQFINNPVFIGIWLRRKITFSAVGTWPMTSCRARSLVGGATSFYVVTCATFAFLCVATDGLPCAPPGWSRGPHLQLRGPVPSPHSPPPGRRDPHLTRRRCARRDSFFLAQLTARDTRRRKIFTIARWWENSGARAITRFFFLLLLRAFSLSIQIGQKLSERQAVHKAHGINQKAGSPFLYGQTEPNASFLFLP